MNISRPGWLRHVLLLASLMAASTAMGAPAPQDAADRLDEAREEVRRLLNAKEYDAAIQKLITLRSSHDLATRKFGQEFLGVARERKGQLEFASLEYKRFLDQFPDAPEVSRVRMRLGALVRSTLPVPVDSGVARTRRPARTASSPNVRGALGVSYRGSQSASDAGETTTSLSLIGTDLDLAGSAERGASKLGFRVAAGHYADLLPDHRNNSDRFGYLYADYGLGEIFSIRLGRQRAKTRAIPGRFDGLNLTLRMAGGPEFEAFGGLPADTSKSGLFADDRKFAGIGVNTGGIWRSFTLGVYGLHQTIDGVVDRQAVGTELRYVGDGMFAQAFVDFDTHFNTLNAISLSFNKMNQGQGSFNVSYNYQKSPYLSTRNALIGQPVDGIQELQNLLTGDGELEVLALDRSLDSQSATFGVGRPLTKQINLSASVSWLAVNGSAASGGVPALPDYQQIYGETRVTFNDFIIEDQNLSMGLAYSKQETSDVWSFMTSTYYRAGNRFRISPRFRVDKRKNADGSEQTNYAPSMRVESVAGPNRFFMQGGYLLYQRRFPTLDSQSSSVRFIYIGYQYRF
jgi:hypothetical protein